MDEANNEKVLKFLASAGSSKTESSSDSGKVSLVLTIGHYSSDLAILRLKALLLSWCLRDSCPRLGKTFRSKA